ncbi:MAG: Cysteine-rich small domain protein [Methanosaeta sp. PtaU1.Bin112]|nr:MAG: Cysteine-rich small domain protein [Methanosaeta sp. PtaU1.Bin112]
MQRLNCEKFPCHFSEQDCSLCFCPFYPCREKRTGGREKDDTWCCENCIIIHQPEVAAMVLDSLMNGEEIKSVWKKLEARL